jgi:hypothetical protein
MPGGSGWPRRTEEFEPARPRGDAPRFADAFEPERFGGADLALDREAPDRPAGRLVAVVTVRNRVVPLRRLHGDTTGGPQTVTITGTIMGRWRVRSPTSRPRALRATRLRVS